MINRLRSWYRRQILARTRRQAQACGEIFFDKYERDGAYHWDFYYGDREPYYKTVMDTVVALMPAGGDVLDIGCGDGLLSHLLTERNKARVTGVDLHPLAIAYAREKNRNANTFAVGSAYDFGASAGFDSAVAIEVFEHLAHPERLVANVFRVLKPGGTFVVSTPLPRSGRPLSHYHVKEFSEDEFKSILEQCFNVVETRRVEGEETTVLCRCVRRET